MNNIIVFKKGDYHSPIFAVYEFMKDPTDTIMLIPVKRKKEAKELIKNHFINKDIEKIFKNVCFLVSDSFRGKNVKRVIIDDLFNKNINSDEVFSSAATMAQEIIIFIYLSNEEEKKELELQKIKKFESMGFKVTRIIDPLENKQEQKPTSY